MKKVMTLLALTAAMATPVFANGGRGMGAGGGMMGGSGMMIVADDDSLLVIEMDASGMMGGGPGSPGAPGTVIRELVNIDANGNDRWRVIFEDGWPMAPCTNGDLVVVVLVDDWFMGFGGSGDGSWHGGGIGGAPGGGAGNGDGESVLVALELATGEERWRSTIPGDMGSMVQFSTTGDQLYVSARESGAGGQMGQGSMRQGQAAGAGFLMSTTIIAFDREGAQLWTYDVGGE